MNGYFFSILIVDQINISTTANIKWTRRYFSKSYIIVLAHFSPWIKLNNMFLQITECNMSIAKDFDYLCDDDSKYRWEIEVLEKLWKIVCYVKNCKSELTVLPD